LAQAQGNFIVFFLPQAQDNQEEVQSSRQPIEMGEIMESCRRAPRAQDNQEEVQSSRQPIKMGEIMESCRKAYESLKHQILQVRWTIMIHDAGALCFGYQNSVLISKGTLVVRVVEY
jgi:hypothetical protein